MSRPLRLQFAGALYHVTTRGDRRKFIYEDDEDRAAFLEILGAVIKDFNWVAHAYCLMGNHYHLLVETPDANLAKGMRQLNGSYTQWSNRRHRRAGHLFDGRYKAVLADKDSYLLELCRYIVLSPVRAKMVKSLERWRWSSYRAMLGAQYAPDWLAVDPLLARFARGRTVARERYRRFVTGGVKAPSPWDHLQGQIYLGDKNFVAQMKRKLHQQGDDINIPLAQRRGSAPSLAQIERTSKHRDVAISKAHETGQYSYTKIGAHFKVHFTTVGRIVRAGKREKRGIDG
jgi:REP element-mobilizing transposase RayT